MSKFTTSLNTDTENRIASKWYGSLLYSIYLFIYLFIDTWIGGKILKNINLIKGDIINKFKGIAK